MLFDFQFYVNVYTNIASLYNHNKTICWGRILDVEIMVASNTGAEGIYSTAK